MNRRAFTLLELLVVIGIIGILIAMISPALEKGTEHSRLTGCGANLHQIGIALTTYANDSNNRLPLGPSTPSALYAARPWNTLGNNQVWIASISRYNGLGVLAAGGWVSDPRVFVCPSDAERELGNTITRALGGPADVYSSYAFRQLDQRSTDTLTGLVMNGLYNRSSAVALDWQSQGPAPFAHSSHDSGEYLNILCADGHVDYFPNDGLIYGAHAADYNSMPTSYVHRLDQVWINADWSQSNPGTTPPALP